MPQGFDNATVGEIAATDLRVAMLFEQFGIDFCCGGRQTIDEACRRAAVDPTLVRRQLAALPPKLQAGDEEAIDWPLDRIIDHIFARHHTYVRQVLPVIGAYLNKLESVHGQRHPELAHVHAALVELSHDLLQHMYKEERILFPYIRDLVRHAAYAEESLFNPFGTIENPIRMMEREHEEAGDALRLIRGLTDGYTTPADGCATYAACMAELREFERDLHRHVHLENNILFPRAIALEASLSHTRV
jgi:regulator of cell morphogenesis and NO signaling